MNALLWSAVKETPWATWPVQLYGTGSHLCGWWRRKRQATCARAHNTTPLVILKFNTFTNSDAWRVSAFRFQYRTWSRASSIHQQPHRGSTDGWYAVASQKVAVSSPDEVIDVSPHSNICNTIIKLFSHEARRCFAWRECKALGDCKWYVQPIDWKQNKYC
jgi:hypothetical protein